MLYLVNLNKLESIGLETNEEDQLSIFCKENDSVKLNIVEMLLKEKAEIDFVPVDGKDDMLVCLGAMLTNVDECVYLDDSIPLPKRFAGKVKTVKKIQKKARKKSGRTPETKEEGQSDDQEGN